MNKEVHIQNIQIEKIEVHSASEKEEESFLDYISLVFRALSLISSENYAVFYS